MRKLSYSDRPNIPRANELLFRYTGMGIFFNKTKMDLKIQEFTSILNKLNSQLLSIVGYEFKIGSSQQYAEVLINKCGVPPKLLTRNGKYYTNKDVLAEVQKQMDIPLINIVNEIKTYTTKLNGLTGDKGIVNYIHDTDLKTDDGDEIVVIFPKVSILETGRFQFSNPNIGNLTPEVMELIVAPKGYTIVKMDIRQQEPTIMFNGVLNSKHFKKLFKDNLNDKYIAIAKFCLAQNDVIGKLEEFISSVGKENLNASMWVWQFLKKDLVTGELALGKKKSVIIDYEVLNNYIVQHLIKDIPCDREQRELYKLALLSGSYGAYESTLISKVGEEAGRSFYRMLDNLPEMVEYEDRASRYLKSTKMGEQYVYTVFGTCLKLNPYDSKGKKRDFRAMLRLMRNYPNQGTGADMLRFLINDFYDWTLENNLSPMDIRILTSRHDELVLLVKDEYLDRVDEVKDLMELQVEDWAPILVKMETGKYYPAA